MCTCARNCAPSPARSRGCASSSCRAYAPDLNPVEGIWSSLKRGPLANLAVTGYAHLLQVIKHGLKKIQYQPGLIESCLTGTGLSLTPDGTDIKN